MKTKPLETFLFSAVGIAAMFVLLVGFNVVSAAFKVRFDVTEEGAYTLSEGTRAILRKLDTPVKLRFYSSRVEEATPDTVFLRNYARQIEDFLEELEREARGRIILEKYDPQPDSDAEDSARLDGIGGQPIPPYGENYYLGLSVNMLDRHEQIRFFTPNREKLLEYDVIRCISRVASPEKPVVGVMSALPVLGMPSNPMMMQMGQRGQEPWFFIRELQNDFTVRDVPLSAGEIDDDIQVLVVLYPKGISDDAQFAIDQFVLRGGKLLAFLDPMSIADNQDAGMNQLQRATSGGATLDKLLAAWGLGFDVSKVVADRTYSTTISRGGPGGETTPAVLSLTSDAVATDDVLTSQIDNLLFAYSGAFTGTPTEGLKMTVLLKTTKQAGWIDKVMAQFGGGGDELKSDGVEYPLAVRLTGRFKTAFPEGKPGTNSAANPPAGDETNAPPALDSLKESMTEGVVCLVADSDVVFDPVCVRVQNILGFTAVSLLNGNLGFAQGAIEQLAGDSNLIAVRSRATLNRPFTVVKRIQDRARESTQEELTRWQEALQQARQELNELQGRTDPNQRAIISTEFEAKRTELEMKAAEANRSLKEVRKRQRKELDSLESWVKAGNIAGMPLLVIIAGIVLAVLKRKRTAAQ